MNPDDLFLNIALVLCFFGQCVAVDAPDQWTISYGSC
jgi:hypothetical protein